MPSITAAQLVAEVKVTGDEEAKSKLDSVSHKVKETGEGFGGMLKNAIGFAAGQAIFMGVGDAISFVKDQIASTIDVTEQYQQTQAQTVQALKSTKDVSGETVKSINDLADAYSRTTEFSADTVQGGENLLLTFTNIGKDVFPQATQAILDVSQAMGQDLKSSAIQVGKALGDPTTGMTALQRIGVTFSEEEKKQIKTMMQHNDIIGAQKIILHELSTEFGGSAMAASKTFAGQMDIMNHQFEDMKVQIGSALLPVLNDMITKYITPLIGKFSDWMFNQGGLQDIQNIFKTIADFLTTTLLPNLGNLLNTYIIPLATQMYDLFIKSGWVHDAFQTVSNILGDLVPKVFGLATDIGNVVGWFQKAGPQGDILKGVLFGIGTVIAGINIKELIGDFVTFATQTIPQTIAKIGDLTGVNGLLGIQDAAQKAAGAQGIGEIGPAMDTAAATAKGDIAAMGSDLLGLLPIIGLLTVAAGTIWQKIAPKAPFPNAPTPLGPNGPVLPINPGGGNRGPGWGKAPGANLPGFASGGPVTQSGWYNFMENGIEGIVPGGSGTPAYLPAGTQVIPNNVMQGTQSGTGQPVILSIDGYQFATVILPYVAQALRNNLMPVGM